MKPALQLTLLTLAVAAALAGGYWAGTRNAAHAPASGAPSASAAGAETGGRQILYYRNPMGLPDTSPVPKKDSMGMDYIPVYAGEDGADDSGAVTVSPARLQTLGVRTAAVELQPLDEPVRAVGRVAINERATYDVAPRFEGWIERLHVNASGDPVRRGQPLFTAYSPELLSAGDELRIAERLQSEAAETDPAAAEAARRLAEATRARVSNWQMKLPEGAQAGKGRLTFSAPATGIVLEKTAVEGMRFMPGEALYRIADLSTVWVLADVYERDLARVRTGQTADVTLDAFPGKHFQARVAYIYPTLDAATRTTPIRLELANPEGLLRPGLFAHADIAVGAPQPVLTVPASALIDSGERQVVLLAQGEGRFVPRAVKVGRRGSEHIEIREGVAEGDRVVVSANFLIDSESNLRAALASFTDAPQAAPSTYTSDGVLESIDAAAGTVSITHPEIPALQWPAMTMDFNLASPDLVRGVAPGSAIRFEFQPGEPGEYAVTRMEAVSGNGHKGH